MPVSRTFRHLWHYPLIALIATNHLQAGLSIIHQEPQNAATRVCTDTPLQITFNKNIQLGASGKITVIRSRDRKVVETLDISNTTPENDFGIKRLNYEPFRIKGNTLTVQLHSSALVSSTPETYSIAMTPGMIRASSGESFTGLSDGTWTFTTREPLAAGKTKIVVAHKSEGDFCTLQGAVDSIPEDNFTPVEIQIRNGTYDSITYLGPGRNHVRIIGEDRKQTVLAGRNNENLNIGRMGRAFLSVDSDHITLENLSVHNTTPHKGSQAEALRLEGQQCTIRNCDFISYQDTLLLNGRIYVHDCYIEGDVDFIWGHGTTFFENCELKAVHDGYYVTSRNPKDRFGFVFLNCKLTASAGVKKNWLARIDATRFPHSAVAFINCEMGAHIPEAAWLIAGETTQHLQFLEYRSRLSNGEPIDTTQRHPASRQLSEEEAGRLSNPNHVLSNNPPWMPRASEN